MPSFFILEFGLLAALVTYLVLSIARRHLAEAMKREAREEEWQPRTFDTSSISRQIELLRSDYVTAIRRRPPESGWRGRLLACAKQAVNRSSYFQRANLEVHDGATEMEEHLTRR